MYWLHLYVYVCWDWFYLIVYMSMPKIKQKLTIYTEKKIKCIFFLLTSSHFIYLGSVGSINSVKNLIKLVIQPVLGEPLNVNQWNWYALTHFLSIEMIWPQISLTPGLSKVYKFIGLFFSPVKVFSSNN